MINIVKSAKNAFGLLLLICMFFTNKNISFSQTNNTLIPKINIPTSPEAALFSRFGDIPVGYYTGTTNISIPLYTIKEDGIEISISLQYHSSGIKVEDQATWVGLGWDLSPGGAIVQEVRGRRDAFDDNLRSLDFPTQYANLKTRLNNAGSIGSYKVVNQRGSAFYGPSMCPAFCSPSIDWLGNCECLPSTLPTDPPNSEPDEMVGSLLLGNGDPDIYHYNFGGHTGKFYINPETQLPVLIDKKEQIYFTRNGESSIIATTLDGTEYHFGAVEYAYEDGYMDPLLSRKSGRTYKLSSIQFLNGKSIDFSYVDTQISGKEYTQKIVLAECDYAPGESTINIPPQLISKKSNAKTLIMIKTSDAIINFNLEPREDINLYATDNVQRLKSIDIISLLTNKKVKTFLFGYSYFPYNLNGTIEGAFNASQIDALGKRLKLDNIKEIGYNENQVAVNTIPPYQFEYDMTNTMPIVTSFAKDFWGYYNGAFNNQLLPDLGYFEYPDMYLVQTNNTPFTFNYVGANRYTDNSKAGAYLLKKVTYPTGGYTELGYEPNSFTNQYIVDQAYFSDPLKNINKVVISNSVDHDSNEQLDINCNTKIHFEVRFDNGKYNANGLPALTANDMHNCYFKFYKFDFVNINGNSVAQTTLIKQLDFNDFNTNFESNGGQVWSVDKYITYDPNASPYMNYKIEVYFPNTFNPNYNSTAGVTAHYTYYDNTVIGDLTSKQCGIRIKSIKNYTSNGVLANNKSYKYFDGKLLNRFDPITTKYVSAFRCESDQNECPTVMNTTYLNAELSISPDFIKNVGTMIGYGKVEETELANDNSNYNGIKTFEFMNFENLCSSNFPVVENLQNGLPSKEKYFNLAGDLVYEKTFDFHDLSTSINCYYGLQIVCNWRGLGKPLDISGNTGSSLYSYYATPIISEWNMLRSTTTTQYLNDNPLAITESYTYNEEGCLKTVITENSRKEILQTKNYYPIEGTSYVDQYMASVHNTGRPAITEKYNGTNLISRQRTLYGSFPSVTTMLPAAVYSNNTDGIEEKRVTINSYNNKGDVTQYIEENNISHSIIYAYNQLYPVAETKNATIAECDYTGFENHEAPGWSVLPEWYTDNTVDIKTGKSAVKTTGYGPTKYFSVGTLANNHSGYKASVWVRGGTDAYLHIQVNEDYSLSKRVTNPTNSTNSYNLIEIELPYAFYKNSVSPTMKIKVYCGSSGTAYFDDLRIYPTDAQMTTYTYDPLIGVTSVSDVNNKPTIYKYDTFNRLSYVKDFKGNILKKYDYHYRPN